MLSLPLAEMQKTLNTIKDMTSALTEAPPIEQINKTADLDEKIRMLP